MYKGPQKIYFSIIFALGLFSCASGAPISTPVYENNSSGIGRSSEVSTEDRMVTYSVSLKLSVKNIEEARTILITQIKNNNGFIINESENYLTTRIPAINMDNFIAEAKVLGRVENERKTGTDITDQYRDNIIRLESMKNVRDRYLALLEKANTVTDILNIEKELERINTGIELLEGKIKYAELSAAYSNITIRFAEKTKPGPVGWIFYGIYYGIKWLFVWN
jgi:hypothetical protein